MVAKNGFAKTFPLDSSKDIKNRGDTMVEIPIQKALVLVDRFIEGSREVGADFSVRGFSRNIMD